MIKLLVLIIVVFFDFGSFQDISADDLKLLEAYQLQRLQDFVRGRGRGFVSKVPFEEILQQESSSNTNEATSEDDLFQEERRAQAARSPSNANSNDQDVIEIGEFQGAPDMSKMFQVVPPPKPMKPGEHLIMPNLILPSSSTTTTEKPKRRKSFRRPVPSTTEAPLTSGPTNEDFEELAKILQKFRKSQTTPAPTTTTTTIPQFSTLRPRFRSQGLSTVVEQTIPEFQEFVVSPLREKWKGLATALPSNSRPKNLFGGINIRPSKVISTPTTTSPIPLDISQKVDNGELVAVTQEEWEEKMREISRKLGSYLMAVKKKKEQEGAIAKGSYQVNGVTQEISLGAVSLIPEKAAIRHQSGPKAYVTILREGFLHQTGNNQFTFVASISLIRDHGKVILVDTGLATDINGRTDLIQKLSKLNIAPPLVDYVVVTHGHPDHAGNTNDFPDSVHYQGNFIHYRTKFNISELSTANSTNLTPNVRLIKTPGHTSEDISVIVSNTDKYGTIAIAGDVFISHKDLDYPMMWKMFSSNESTQDQSRRDLICLANYIVPGHDRIFRVTSEMKNGANCHRSKSHGTSRRKFLSRV